MTRYTLDIASYQGALATADVVRAGFDGVNLKTSHGTGLTSVHPDVSGWVTRARAAKLGISTFHWLTADATGAAQAVHAWQRLQALGLTKVGHVVDIEAPGLTWTVIAEYTRAMAAYLGRTVFAYSADWRWEAGWTGGSGLTPYLWAAPNAGYLGSYPGDASTHWNAGYGGWGSLAVMQYAVAPLIFPDGSSGSIKVSKSAVRSETVWAALTGGTVAWNPARGSKPDYTVTSPPAATAPTTRAHRWFVERLIAMEPGTQNGGTYAAKPGYHNRRNALPADDYSVRATVDQQGPADKCAATDWTFPDAQAGNYTGMVKYGQRMRASYNDRTDPRLNGWREALGQFDVDAPPEAIDFRGRYERVPDDTHRWHWHFSETRANVESFDNKWAMLTVLLGWTTAEWRQSMEDDMAITEADVRTLATAQVWPAPPATGITGAMSLQNLLTYIFNRAVETKGLAGDTKALTGGVSGALSAYIAAEATDDRAKAEALTALQQAVESLPVRILDMLGDPGIPNEQIAASLKQLLGDRADPVGALMQGQ